MNKGSFSVFSLLSLKKNMRNYLAQFNVGGTVYWVHEDNLRESSFLTLRVTENPSYPSPFFIDRDRFLFRYILLYLRTGELDIEKKYWKSVKKEAEFYQIPILVAMLHEMIKKDQPKKTVYKLLDDHEFSRFSNIDINSSTGSITSCTAVGSDKRFITSIQCDTAPYNCPRGIYGHHAPHHCSVACNEARDYVYGNGSPKKNYVSCFRNRINILLISANKIDTD